MVYQSVPYLDSDTDFLDPDIIKNCHQYMIVGSSLQEINDDLRELHAGIKLRQWESKMESRKIFVYLPKSNI